MTVKVCWDRECGCGWTARTRRTTSGRQSTTQSSTRSDTARRCLHGQHSLDPHLCYSSYKFVDSVLLLSLNSNYHLQVDTVPFSTSFQTVLRIRVVHPGSEFFPSRIQGQKIPDKENFSILNRKIVSKISEI
jgi:hypothetical protein